MQEIADILKSLTSIIESEYNIPQSEKDEVIDDIEIAIEQLESAKPKLGKLKNVCK